MDKRTRAGKIYEAGLAESEHCLEPVNESMLKAIATMIDYATKKPKKKEKKQLLYNEQDVLKVVNYDLKPTRWGGLNRVLSNLSLQENDLELFEVWFREIMYPWMHSKDIEFTFSMLTRKYPEWLEKARQYKGDKNVSASAEGWR